MGNLCAGTPTYLPGLGGKIREGTRVQTRGWHFMECTEGPAADAWYVGTATKLRTRGGRRRDGMDGQLTVEYDDATVCLSHRFPSAMLVHVLPPGHPGHDVKVMGGSASKDGQAAVASDDVAAVSATKTLPFSITPGAEQKH